MKFIKKYMHTTAISAVLLFSSYIKPLSLVTTAAWLKCKLGLSVVNEKIDMPEEIHRSISFENDLLDAIKIYSIPQLYLHWPVQILKSLVHKEEAQPEIPLRSSYADDSHADVFESLELHEKVIQLLELDHDDTYEDACEILIDIVSPDMEEELDENRRKALIELLDIPIKKNTSLSIDDIEDKGEFEHIKSILHHTVSLTGIFEKIGKEKLTKLWKTIKIKANGVNLPHDYITNIPVKDDMCTISVTLPIETFAQLLEAQGLRCILSDEPISEDSPCLIDTQKFLQEHTWIRSGIKHLQKHDSIWNSFIARYINMQVVFTYTFNVREFESDTIRINYLLLSQINKWAQNPPAVTPRYRPFQTIEIIVNNKDA